MSGDPLPSHSESQSWKHLGWGGPTILSLAELAASRWTGLSPAHPSDPDELGTEAKTILALARQHGVIELKATNVAFDSTERLLTVHVQLTEHRQIRFRKAGDARLTQKFLDGFRQLCGAGLVLHQLYQEFCLTTLGFEWADRIDRNSVADSIDSGEVVGWTDND